MLSRLTNATRILSVRRRRPQPGQFYGVHSITSDSKGNLYTTETYEGKRVQKFIYRVGSMARGYQGVLWPRRM